jgi:hypothetical protein
MSRAARGIEAFRGVALPLALFGLALSLGACFSDRPTEPSGGGAVSFAADIQPIFSGSCAFSGCHGTTNANPAGKPMVLTSGQSYDAIVGVASDELPSMQRIRASQPDQSYLIHKLQNTHRTVGGSGERMPLGQAALPQSSIDRIRTWVTNGAPRN